MGSSPKNGGGPFHRGAGDRERDTSSENDPRSTLCFKQMVPRHCFPGLPGPSTAYLFKDLGKGTIARESKQGNPKQVQHLRLEAGPAEL